MTYLGHILCKKGDYLENEITQGATPGSRARGRPSMAGQYQDLDWKTSGTFN